MTRLTQGCFGCLHRVDAPVHHALSPDFTARWTRFINMMRDQEDGSRPSTQHDWRFTARPGLFGQHAVSGVCRTSRDAQDRSFPFAVVLSGAALDPAEAWFDRAAVLCLRIVAAGRLDDRALRDLDRLPPPALPVAASDAPARFWRDDWEVMELSFASGGEMVERGLAGTVL